MTGVGTWWDLAAWSALLQGDLLRHLDHWGSSGNLDPNSSGEGVGITLGLLDFIFSLSTQDGVYVARP